MTKKLLMKTWGCQMNEYDSARTADLLCDTMGYEITENENEADVYLLITCSIREKAHEKVFHQLGRWKDLKESRPDIIIGVGGCVASQDGEMIRERAPFVDLIFGPQTLHRVPEMIQRAQLGEKGIIDISFPEIEKFDHLAKPRAEGPSAFVTIMEGCSKFCSYCVVPYTRGAEISRPLDDVLYEVAQLAEQGVREINLLGQNVDAYRGLTHDGNICSFSELLHLVASIDGIDRLRFTTSHPAEFTDDIIDAYKDIPELVDFLHLPVQSGSNHVLEGMQRPYTAEEYKEIIRKMLEVRPNMTISSDFIVAFPTETDEDFEETMQLIKDVDFDMSFSFIYSPRPGTPAADYPNEIPSDVKKERLQRLQHQINKQAMSYSRRMLNTTQRILVTGVSKKNMMELKGRTENNRVVNFEAPAECIGQFVDVKIVDIYPNSLRGELIRTESDMDLRSKVAPAEIIADKQK